MEIMQTRRRFLAGAAMAGAAGLVGAPRSLHAEPPPETTSVRLPQWIGSAYCWAAEYLAGELLRAEGFTDVRYFEGDKKVDHSVWIARGETDFSLNYPPIHVASIDAAVPIKVLAGLHSGCLELIANESIRNIPDLKGKRVGIGGLGWSEHVHLTLMVAYVGLDPERDIQWVIWPAGSKPADLLLEGKIDAFISAPPRSQQAHARKIGHTIVNTTTDMPWSQHFCCMICATADYVNKYPVATKRVLRAMFKAADLCVSDPQWVAQQLVKRDFVPSYDYVLQTLNAIRYDRWREFDPEDTLRFYALRMHEAGFIKAGPNKIIAESTDWHFLDELKRELKT
jgi:NitT/TauT family transport system substrate-binding protein